MAAPAASTNQPAVHQPPVTSLPRYTRHGTTTPTTKGTSSVKTSPRSHNTLLLYAAVFYSYRSATSGSTFDARRAGHHVASSAMIVSTAGATAKVTKSVAVTPNSR